VGFTSFRFLAGFFINSTKDFFLAFGLFDGFNFGLLVRFLLPFGLPLFRPILGF